MPDTKITALAAITTVDPAADVLPIVDISDTSMAASGTTKKITSNQILGAGGTATLASATISGDLTVDTSTLKVDSANNRVGIGTATPGAGYALDVVGAVRITAANGLVIDKAGAGFVDFLNSGNAGANVGTSGTGGLVIYTANGIGGAYSVRHTIAGDGVATWSNVGGVAGTAMTLNATGLGVGVTPAAGDGSGVFKAAGTGVGTANTRMGIDTRETTSGNAAGIWIGAMNSENTGVIGSRTASGNIAFQTFNGSSWGERMRIDYLGNVGIGVTPSAWAGIGPAFEMPYGSISGYLTGYMYIAQNAFWQSAWKYKNTAAASYYQQQTGQHQWYTAPSGTAGNAITFTQAMTLDASGNLLVGTTSSPAGAKVGAITKLSGVSAEGTASINVSTTPVALSRATGTSGLFFVMGYNASGGAGGWYLVASTGSGTPTVISSGGTPGLTLTFTMVGGQLNAQTASGTFVANAFSITA